MIQNFAEVFVDVLTEISTKFFAALQIHTHRLLKLRFKFGRQGIAKFTGVSFEFDEDISSKSFLEKSSNNASKLWKFVSLVNNSL